jgi:hypothetical protein
MVASGIANDWMDIILGLIFGATGSPYSAPATLYFGLCTAIDADGTVTGEPSSGSYARKDVTNNTTLWNTPNNGAMDNKAIITFVAATGSWGTITNFFIADSLTLTGSHIIAYGTLTTPKAITTGDTASFAAGDLDISLTATA